MIGLPDSERKRRWLWGLAATLLLGLAVAVAILSQSQLENAAFVVLPRTSYGAIVGGLVGLVFLFVLYATLRHRELAVREIEVQRLAVRAAAFQGRLTEILSLLDTSSELAHKMDVPEILRLAASRVLPCLEADHSTVHLYDPRGGLLEVVASVGKKAVDGDVEAIRPGEGVVGYVFASREALIVDSAEMCSRLGDELRLPRAPRSALCVAIRFENTALGVLSVARIDVDEPFVAMHSRALQALAGHCGAAIVKSFHYRRIAREAAQAA